MVKRLVILFALIACQLPAVDYHVNRKGKDDNDGRTEKSAFLSIQKGVDALSPGDTLTIEPGEYFGAVEREDLGSLDKETVIQAKIPGTVLLRGDVPAPEFKRVEGYRFVWSAPFDKKPEAVLEIDTLRRLRQGLGVPFLELNPGTFFHDPDEKTLYISTTDMAPPSRHLYSVAVVPKSGLRLNNAKRVVIDGLAATGFHITATGWSIHSIWGFRLDDPVDCVIRDCVAYLNGGGISLVKGGSGNVIEDCVAYGNFAHAMPSGNIRRFGGTDDVIRDCFSYKGSRGISFYGKGGGPVLLKNVLGWGNGLHDFRIKGHGDKGTAVAENCVAVGHGVSHHTKHCLVSYNDYQTTGMPKDNAYFGDCEKTRHTDFADPDNLDFRPQSGSTLRGSGPNGADRGPFPYQANIFFVKPDGDDASDGASVTNAWKTIKRAIAKTKSGDTIYLCPGVYEEAVDATIQNREIRGRGVKPVVLKGKVTLNDCGNLVLERLYLLGGFHAKAGQDLSLNNCVLADFRVDSVGGFKAIHCVFTKSPLFRNCPDMFMSGNIQVGQIGMKKSAFAYSDYNSYPDATVFIIVPDKHSLVATPDIAERNGVPTVLNDWAFAGRGPDGTAIGLYLPYRPEPIKFAGPFVHSAGAAAANVEWWTNLPSTCVVAWGETPACDQKLSVSVNGYGSCSLTGLKPGKTYHFAIRSVAPKEDNYNVNIMAVTPKDAAVSFKTRAKPLAPKTYHVAKEGDDGGDGLTRETALRTINAAAAKADAGDTVLVHEGVYVEAIVARATGTKDRPVTFKSAPGEKVTVSGGQRLVSYAFKATDKKHLRFDGFYVSGQGSGPGAFWLTDCDDVAITRCLVSGMGRGYPCIGIVDARDTSNLLIKNCVTLNFMGSIMLRSCPNFRLENSVSLVPMITHANIANLPSEKATFKNNILTDNQLFKLPVHTFEIARFDSLDFENNCHFLRVPDDKRRMFLFCNFDQGVPYGEAYKKLKPPKLHGRASLKDYFAAMGEEGGELFRDPKFKGLIGVDVSGKDRKGNPIFPPDKLKRADVDFDDFFATDPEVVKRGMGLQPEAFKDFKFK